MNNAIEAIFALSRGIRYVAVYRGDRLESRQRDGLEGASSGESDKYEELLVNPTVLTLTGQRGRIDCGGLRFVVVGYGHFNQLLVPLPDGHASVAFEANESPFLFVEEIRSACVNAETAPPP